MCAGPSKKRKLNKEETLKELEGRGAAAGPTKVSTLDL